MSETARTPGAAPVWPDKMITQAEAFAKAATWSVIASAAGGQDPGAPDINLVCGECCRSMGQLRRGTVVYNGSLDEMLSMVLRHMVMAHDVPLNTRAPGPGAPAGIPGPPALGPAVHRVGRDRNG